MNMLGQIQQALGDAVTTLVNPAAGLPPQVLDDYRATRSAIAGTLDSPLERQIRGELAACMEAGGMFKE